MPQVCFVFGCCNRSNREKGKGYYRVPKVIAHRGEKWKKLTQQRRKKWIANLRLQTGVAESANARVCGDHFVKGCPSALLATESVDWAPTVKLGYQNTKRKSQSSVRRDERMKQKEDLQSRLECAEGMLDLKLEAPTSDWDYKVESDEQDGYPESAGTTKGGGYADAGCQTDLTMDDLEKMEEVLRENLVELGDLRSKALDSKFTQESFENNEEKTRFYTGLPNFLVLMQIFRLCEPDITCGPLSVLSKFEQFILVLLRLRLNLSLKDLAFRFNISLPTASRVWHKLIDVLHDNLKFQLECPERHGLCDTMPMAFREALGSKYQILQSKAMATKPGEALALIDKIGVICCVLSNHSESTVSLE
ncbi:uncharacterized protein PAE49_024445 [Odontesthes bonariensis]|uniref:uncharacterized protein LOC142372703 n=1 Tax=Odontesthes bonariensis TaxID=219752 RepID=UPI003F58102C